MPEREKKLNDIKNSLDVISRRIKYLQYHPDQAKLPTEDLDHAILKLAELKKDLDDHNSTNLNNIIINLSLLTNSLDKEYVLDE